MKTLLVNLPWRVAEGRYGVRAGSRWPFTIELEQGKKHYLPFPFFLAYAASLLKENKKEAKLFDFIAENWKKKYCIERIKEYNPDLLLAETSTPSFYNDIDILRNIRNSIPFSQLAICGPHASTFPEKILSDYEFLDYVLIGEYEYTLLELVSCLEENGDLNTIFGLAYREGKEIIKNPYRKTIADLDSLPWPEREDVPIYNYNDGFCGLPKPNVQMWASRGCPFECTFCLWPQVMYREHKYRKRDVKDVVDEMEYLVNKYNFKAVYFDDDVFNIDRKYTLSICKEIMDRNVKIPWACMARVDLMDEELLEIMGDAGLYAIKYGIESADKEILKRCKKNIDLDKAKRIINYTKKIGIKTHLTFCVGLPAETSESINKTVKFIKDVNPDSLQISYAVPFPGTDLYSNLENKFIRKPYNWSSFDGNCDSVVCIDGLSREILKERKDTLKGIRFSK